MFRSLLDHPQGAYVDPSYSYTVAELSINYIVKSYALLGQHVFQAVVCIECSAECDAVTLCTAQGPKHVWVNTQTF
jgi:hypothetical protein